MRGYNFSIVISLLISVASLLPQTVAADNHCEPLFKASKKSNIVLFPKKRDGVTTESTVSIPKMELTLKIENTMRNGHPSDGLYLSPNLKYFVMEQPRYDLYGSLEMMKYEVYNSNTSERATEYRVDMASARKKNPELYSPNLVSVQNDGTLLIHLYSLTRPGPILEVRPGSDSSSRGHIRGEYSRVRTSADGKYIFAILEKPGFLGYFKGIDLTVYRADTLEKVWHKSTSASGLKFDTKKSTVEFEYSDARDKRSESYDLETGASLNSLTRQERADRKNSRFIKIEELVDNPNFYSLSAEATLLKDEGLIHIRNQFILDMISEVEIASRKVVTDYKSYERMGQSATRVQYVGGQMQILKQDGDFIAYQSFGKQNARTVFANVDIRGNSQVIQEYVSERAPMTIFMSNKKDHFFIDRISDQVFRVWNIKSMKFIDIEAPIKDMSVGTLSISDDLTTAHFRYRDNQKDASDSNVVHWNRSAWFKLPASVVEFLSE